MAFWNNIDSCNFHDPFSKFNLSEIPDDLDRIKSLIVRHKSHELVADHFYTLAGAFEILKGMKYHYQNILKLNTELTSGVLDGSHITDKILHESVAYQNRIGQFYYFTTSELISEKIGRIDEIAPVLCRANIFRNKHAAHRSIDKPFKEDTAYMQEQHAISMNKYCGAIWSPKPGHKPGRNPLEINSSNHYLMSQVQLDDGETVLYFCVEKDHPLLTAEAYSIYHTALSS